MCNNRGGGLFSILDTVGMERGSPVCTLELEIVSNWNSDAQQPSYRTI